VVGAEKGRRFEAVREATYAAVGGVPWGGVRPPVRSGEGRRLGEERKPGEEWKEERAGGGQGVGPRVCGANSARLRCEAQFELLSSAWLRRLFRVRWALPRSAEPGYQTTKIGKRWDEVRVSELPQPTKHTLPDLTEMTRS
jgi:hypothetical protein